MRERFPLADLQQIEMQYSKLKEKLDVEEAQLEEHGHKFIVASTVAGGAFLINPAAGAIMFGEALRQLGQFVEHREKSHGLLQEETKIASDLLGLAINHNQQPENNSK